MAITTFRLALRPSFSHHSSFFSPRTKRFLRNFFMAGYNLLRGNCRRNSFLIFHFDVWSAIWTGIWTRALRLLSQHTTYYTTVTSYSVFLEVSYYLLDYGGNSAQKASGIAWSHDSKSISFRLLKLKILASVMKIVEWSSRSHLLGWCIALKHRVQAILQSTTSTQQSFGKNSESK